MDIKLPIKIGSGIKITPLDAQVANFNFDLLKYIWWHQPVKEWFNNQPQQM